MKNFKEWRLLAAALAAAIALTGAIAMPFVHRKNELASLVRAKALELRRSREFVSRKDDIARSYAAVASASEGSSLGEWVKKLTAAAESQGITFDSILPRSKDVKAGSGELGVILKFHADLGGLAGVVHALATDDPLVLVEDMTVNKMDNGFLDCEINLSKVFLR